MLQYPQEPPDISVKNIQLPDDFQSRSFGYSLEKWSKKRPRLRSGSKTERRISCHRFDEHDDNFCDVTEILESLESNREEVADHEVNSDIEELWRKTQESEEISEEQKTGILSRKRAKRKLKKTIKFSFSRPASPQTEQIIRVDVSSNISIEDFGSYKEVYNKGHFRKTKDDMKQDGVPKEMEFKEQDLIFRCSQLALDQKQR